CDASHNDRVVYDSFDDEDNFYFFSLFKCKLQQNRSSLVVSPQAVTNTLPTHIGHAFPPCSPRSPTSLNSKNTHSPLFLPSSSPSSSYRRKFQIYAGLPVSNKLLCIKNLPEQASQGGPRHLPFWGWGRGWVIGVARSRLVAVVGFITSKYLVVNTCFLVWMCWW